MNPPQTRTKLANSFSNFFLGGPTKNSVQAPKQNWFQFSFLSGVKKEQLRHELPFFGPKTRTKRYGHPRHRPNQPPAPKNWLSVIARSIQAIRANPLKATKIADDEFQREARIDRATRRASPMRSARNDPRRKFETVEFIRTEA